MRKMYRFLTTAELSKQHRVYRVHSFEDVLYLPPQIYLHAVNV